MMNKLLSVVAVAAFLTQPVYSQSRASDSIKQVKAGEAVQLADGVTLKVTRAAKSQFGSVKVKGEPIVVVLELDAGNKSATLGYKLSTDPALSDVYLAGGSQKLAPRAVIEDFQSWGKDNDKEIEVLDPKDNAVGVSLQFQGKGSVSLLFDVPPEQAKVAKKVSLVIKTVKPTFEEHSFVVTL